MRSSTLKVTMISAEQGGWHALYVDDKRSHEGHSVRIDYLLQDMGVEYEFFEMAEDYAECIGFDKSLAVAMQAVNKEVNLPDWCTE
jgi:hypothetical protein